MIKLYKVIIILIVMASLSTSTMAQEGGSLIKKDGFYLGGSTGTWFPDGKNKVLGHPFMGGLVMELKSGKGALSLVFDIVVNVVNTDTLYIKHNDELVKRNSYTAGQIGLEFDYELYSQNKFSVEAGGGLGFGNITYYNPSKNVDVDKSSLFINPGFSLRYFTGKHAYLKFRAQYYLANYKLKDNLSTPFQGNYPTAKIIFAW